MSIIFGSARHDENGKYTGGKVGDQTGTEVSTQSFYVHSKGWYVLRPKSDDDANKIAEAMRIACDNKNIGYSQSDRYGVIRKGVKTTTPCNADCSTLVRACCIYCDFDPNDFYTGNEVSALEKTGRFKTHFAYTNGLTLCTGDILVTKTKGHTGVIVEGATRGTTPVKTTYTKTQFIKDLQASVGAEVDGIVGNETRSKVMGLTVSTKYNKNHKVVTPLERYMKTLGYYTGSIEADSGKTPIFGNGMAEAIKKYQKNVVKALDKNVDGIISRNGATWKNLLG